MDRIEDDVDAVGAGRWRAALTALPGDAPLSGSPLSLSGALDERPRSWSSYVSIVFWLAVAGFSAYAGLGLVGHLGRTSHGVPLVLVGTAVVVGVAGYVLLRWYARGWAIVALAWLSAASLLSQVLGPGSAAAGFGYVAAAIATARERLWSAAVLGVFGLGGALLVDVATGRDSSIQLLITVAAYVVAIGFALVMRSSREERRRAALAREQAAVAQARSVVLDERARIAREIHDILAHTLSAQSVQLETARLLLRRDGGHPEVADRLEQAQRLTREGMEETRRAVHALRGDELSAPDLLEPVARDAGLTFEVVGEPRELRPEVSLAVLRAGQEAIANVRKHAPNAHGAMVFRYDDGGCGLDVTDDGGSGPAPLSRTGSGYGLTGIRERAELLGGSLDAGAEGAGFALRLRLPA